MNQQYACNIDLTTKVIVYIQEYQKNCNIDDSTIDYRQLYYRIVKQLRLRYKYNINKNITEIYIDNITIAMQDELLQNYDIEKITIVL